MMRNYTQDKIIAYFVFVIIVGISFSCGNHADSNQIQTSVVIADALDKPYHQPEPPLSNDDKTQIILEIFKQENLRTQKKTKNNAPDTSYILAKNLPFQSVFEFENLKIKLINQSEIEVKRQSGIVYYEFRDFTINKRGFNNSVHSVSVSVIWNEKNSSSSHFAAIDYECQQIQDELKCEGKTTSVGVSE